MIRGISFLRGDMKLALEFQSPLGLNITVEAWREKCPKEKEDYLSWQRNSMAFKIKCHPMFLI